ncbi:MAG: molybdopterin cofactor-binding domain-containing protein [Clostridia bacterium]
MKEQFTQIGKSFPVQDAKLKATGQLRYVADMKHPHMLYAKMLFSPLAHAHILSIDTSEAEKLEGVVTIAHTFNTTQVAYNGLKRYWFHEIVEDEYLFSRTVRFVGDRVAVVAAESLEIAAAAIKLIKVEYEELPAVFTMEEALAHDAVDINGKKNIHYNIESMAGDVDQALLGCDKVFTHTYELPALHHACMENHVVTASYTSDGNLTLWVPTQNSISHRMIMSKIFDLPLNKIRIITPALGGGFGGKVEFGFQGVVANLSMMTGRPVKLEFNRKESICSTNTRQAAKVTVTTGVDEAGFIQAQDIHVTCNTGAYATCGGPIILGAMCGKVFKMIKTENLRFRGVAVYTNNTVGGAMRGYGSPQVFSSICSHYNQIALALGMDVTDFYERNLVEPSGIEQRSKHSLGNPRPLDCLHKGIELFHWQEKPLSETRENGRYLYGKGMSVACHGNGIFGVDRDMTAATLRMNEDGTAILSVTSHEMGSGCIISLAQIVAEVLSLATEEVRTVTGDTDAGGWSNGESASRGLFVEGGAAYKVAISMKERLAKYAAEFLQVKAESLVFANKTITSTQLAGRSVTFLELINYVHKTHQEDFVVSETYASVALPGSYGAHFADVLVDTLTGKVQLLDYVAVHDVGKVVNPQVIEGQLDGGIHMGLGYALSEELLIDESGKITTDSFKKYHILHAKEMPNITTAFIEEGDIGGPYGAKSIGEAATVPVAAAVFNAVCNAIGKPMFQYPAKPERILAALKQ